MKKLKFNGSSLVTGPGSLDYVKELDGRRIFIVTGKSSMFKNGTIDHLKKLFAEADKTCEVYAGVGSDPTPSEVLAGVNAMAEFVPDTVLAVGGGSAIDAAKVMTLLCEYAELTIDDIVRGKAPQARYRIALVAAPSTSGTATETTMAAVLTFPDLNIKVGLKTPAFMPDIAILDGNLTLSMPRRVMVESGMDALTHALESYINKTANDFTKSFSREAVLGLSQFLEASYELGDIDSRQKVLNYQYLAGMGFTNAGLGMDHGIAHAFGGRFGTAHGLLNAVALPYVLKYNIQDGDVLADIEELSISLGEDVIERVENLSEKFGVPRTFKEMGIPEEDFLAEFDELVKNSLEGSTKRNPIPMNEVEMAKVLRSIYYGTIEF